MKTIVIVPAYGREYRSKRDLLKDFDAGKDFKVSDALSIYNGKPCNKWELLKGGIHKAICYYNGETSAYTIPIQPEKTRTI